MHDVYVGLGSNIDPAGNLRSALQMLRRAFDVTAVSSVYQSPAHGFAGDDFLNMVVGLRSAALPQSIERDLGNLEHARGRQHEPGQLSSRTLDLDLLIYGHMVEPALRLPRDDTLKYPFVLAPLAEVAPALVHPLTGVHMQDAWSAMRSGASPLERLGDERWLGPPLPADAAATVDR